MKLLEILIKDKEMVGQGAFHKVYPSGHNPNIVYKVGRKGTLQDWVDMFKEYPSLFPKIYGDIKTLTIPIKGFNNQVMGKIDVEYIAIEKLNTKKFIQFYNEIDLYFVENDLLYYLRRYDESVDVFLEVGVEMSEKNPRLYNDYVDFINLVDFIYEIKPSADLHKHQFGYNSNGEIKCLDI